MPSLRWKWLAANLFFGLLHPGLSGSIAALPPSLRALAINLALFIVPASGWALTLTPTRSPGRKLGRYTAISTLLLIGFLVSARALGLSLNQGLAWSALWGLANLGFGAAFARRGDALMPRSLLPREAALGAILFACSYGLFYEGATRFVPLQVDQDLEVQGTGYGLLTRLEPMLLTDRRGVYFFAHPPLLHFYVGGSFLLNGNLGDLEFFDQATRRVRDDWNGRFPAPSAEPPAKDSVEGIEIARIYKHYEQEPHLLETRTPNIFLAAVTIALLGIWIGRISRRGWLGLLAGLACMTIPEVFVRSSYGGYFAIDSFAAMLMLLAVEAPRGRPRPARTTGLIAGAFAAIADHKLVLLPAALTLRAAFVRMRDSGERRLSTLVPPVALGFAAGTAAFWAWGLSISPAAFLQDHLHSHLIDRIAHRNPFGYSGYPSPAGLWAEFIRHTGYALLPAGLLLLGFDLLRRRGRSVSVRAPQRSLWLMWMLLTGLAFTLIDWRQTKHLMPMILPLFLALCPDRGAPRWRVLAPVVSLLGILGANAVGLPALCRDFERFVITPAW